MGRAVTDTLLLVEIGPPLWLVRCYLADHVTKPRDGWRKETGLMYDVNQDPVNRRGFGIRTTPPPIPPPYHNSNVEKLLLVPICG